LRALLLLCMIKQASKREKAGGDFQKAIIYEEKGAMDEKDVMDNKMEDKICDLYELFVQV